MATIKKINALSLAKVMGLIYAFFGAILGAVLTLFSLMGIAYSQADLGVVGIWIGTAGIIIVPVVYGIIGFIFGLLIAALYNLVARRIGGLEIEIQK
jgi:hypothetical protein|tara:strand:+ start:1874 stop:2164 length:291 start_codon:yes stop_codon:yes gene_type:complete